QIRAAEKEFQQLEALYHRALAAPNDPRKQQAMSALERRGYELGLMLNSCKILNNAWRDVQKRAGKVAPLLDELASAERDAVAWAVREASSGDIPDPPVQWGKLSANEGRQKVKDLFGFDPGWGH